MGMIEGLVGALAGFIVAAISAAGYLGVLLLMALESACIPLPSEIIMPFAGYLVSTGRFALWGVGVAGALGCNLGSAVAYEVGRRGGRPFVARWGRYILLDLHDLDRAEVFFARWGGLATFIGRLLPVIRSFIALPAGMARMRLVPFHLYTFFGSLPWCLGLAWIGARLGRAWRTDPRLAPILHGADAVVIVVVLVVAGWFVWRKIRRS